MLPTGTAALGRNARRLSTSEEVVKTPWLIVSCGPTVVSRLTHQCIIERGQLSRVDNIPLSFLAVGGRPAFTFCIHALHQTDYFDCVPALIVRNSLDITFFQ